MKSGIAKSGVTLLLALSVGLGTGTAIAQCCGACKTTAATSGNSQDIVATAASAGNFSTLVRAVKHAGLAEALKGNGPFTVFAPTDEAFAKLPKGTLETLLKPDNKDQLRTILTYHVVSGRLMAADVINKDGVATLNGQRVDFKATCDRVTVDGARIVQTDINASNGVIHVIDTVILPSSENIVTTADNAKSFQTLLAAATKAGLAGTLSNDGPFTVFAPTDEAFAKLPEGTVESLLQPENRDQLAKILKYHVVSGRVYSDDAVNAGQADTLVNQQVKITKGKHGVMVNDARVVMADLDASNGVIHVIDKVILPQ